MTESWAFSMDSLRILPIDENDSPVLPSLRAQKSVQGAQQSRDITRAAINKDRHKSHFNMTGNRISPENGMRVSDFTALSLDLAILLNES